MSSKNGSGEKTGYHDQYDQQEPNLEHKIKGDCVGKLPELPFYHQPTAKRHTATLPKHDPSE